MKKYLLAICLLTPFVATAQPINQSVLQKSMKIWHPVAIAQNADVITLTMNENQVTNAIYMAVIKGGVCPPLWSDAKKTAYLKNIKEIRVLNIHNYIGYVYENPKSSCEELGVATADREDINILSHTHGF